MIMNVKQKFVKNYTYASLLIPDFRDLDVIVAIDCGSVPRLGELKSLTNTPSSSKLGGHSRETELDAIRGKNDARPWGGVFNEIF